MASLLGVYTLLALAVLLLPMITLTLVIMRVLAGGGLTLISLVFAVAVVIGLVGRDVARYLLRSAGGGFTPLDIDAVGVTIILKSLMGAVQFLFVVPMRDLLRGYDGLILKGAFVI